VFTIDAFRDKYECMYGWFYGTKNSRAIFEKDRAHKKRI